MNRPLIEGIEDRTLTVPEYLELVNELISPLVVFVEGEVTDLKVLRDWVFFSLKDAETQSILRCGLHAGVYRRLGANVEEGMAVKVEGYGKLSPKTGNFGFWVKSIEPLGEGALRRAYELLLEKFKSEGLFTRKREIPLFIERIGVISSRDGVVLQDLRKNLAPRGIKINFLHSSVEGVGAADELRSAIKQMSRMSVLPDVLILIRGGGSLESLQGFNNEAVCRALFACPVPTIVGIGHDVDAPIVTLVADHSASTPTAVAHVINSSWAPLVEGLPTHVRTMREVFVRAQESREHRVELCVRALRGVLGVMRGHTHLAVEKFASSKERYRARVEECRHRVLRAREGMSQVFERGMIRIEERMATLTRLLSASDPARALARGYALVYTQGSLVRSVGDVERGAELSMKVADGTISSTVTDTHQVY